MKLGEAFCRHAECRRPRAAWGCLISNWHARSTRPAHRLPSNARRLGSAPSSTRHEGVSLVFLSGNALVQAGEPPRSGGCGLDAHRHHGAAPTCVSIRGARYGYWHPRRDPHAHLRTIFHDQGGRSGLGSGARARMEREQAEAPRLAHIRAYRRQGNALLRAIPHRGSPGGPGDESNA
jgi:hypothetical protein